MKKDADNRLDTDGGEKKEQNRPLVLQALERRRRSSAGTAGRMNIPVSRITAFTLMFALVIAMIPTTATLYQNLAGGGYPLKAMK